MTSKAALGYTISTKIDYVTSRKITLHLQVLSRVSKKSVKFCVTVWTSVKVQQMTPVTLCLLIIFWIDVSFISADCSQKYVCINGVPIYQCTAGYELTLLN
jgi:hypothetical protein